MQRIRATCWMDLVEAGKLTERKVERNGEGRLTHRFQMEQSVMHLDKIQT